MNRQMLLAAIIVTAGVCAILLAGTQEAEKSPPAWTYRVVKNYNIIQKDSAGDLVQSVNKAINCGWNPIGGVVVSNDHYVQAMAK